LPFFGIFWPNRSRSTKAVTAAARHWHAAAPRSLRLRM
jgi:hypothetical protein